LFDAPIKELASDLLKSKEKVLPLGTLKDYRDFFFEKYIIPKFDNLKINSTGKKISKIFTRFSQTYQIK
jgi:hypothetical protein